MTTLVANAAVQRRTLRVLVFTQLLGGVGLAAGVAVGALLARDLLGGDALSGLPSAAATAGGALAAVPISRLMARSGRRPGLATGYLTGGVGAALVLLAAQLRSFPLLVAGMVAFGVGNTASLLARYAAADLAEPQRRGRAVSTVLFATTFGAVAGPNLVQPAGALARTVVISAHIAGMYLLSPLGGWICDRFGALATIRLGGLTLLAAGLAGALASSASVALLTVALFLLGLGWSLSLVGGTTLLTSAVPLGQRAGAQGNADLLVGLAGATGGLGSGLVLALSGFTVLGLLTAAVAVALLATGVRTAAQAR